MKALGRVFLLLSLLGLALTGCGKQSADTHSHDSDKTSADFGVDLGYLMDPAQSAMVKEKIPGGAALDEIIHVGARVLEWADTLQKDVPVEKREQLWRRIDRIGKEASPEKPMTYNPASILVTYHEMMDAIPAEVQAILKGSLALPSSPPAVNGKTLSIKELVDHIRPIQTIYSRASRWMGLYPYHSQLTPASRDLRGWLTIRKQYDALASAANNWSALDNRERTLFLNTVAAACPLTSGESAKSCASARDGWLSDGNSGRQALQWLREVLRKGQRSYDAKFGVRATHPGVTTAVHAGLHHIDMPTYGIPSDTFNWIQERVREAWWFGEEVGVTLYDAKAPVNGNVQVIWEKGALPHVNGVGGDRITMDSNTPKWLEQTTVVMRHEMGHVIGFPDCYTEFWDASQEAFVYYTLDPEDAMCALSGQYLDRHKEALLKGYFSRK